MSYHHWHIDALEHTVIRIAIGHANFDLTVSTLTNILRVFAGDAIRTSHLIYSGLSPS